MAIGVATAIFTGAKLGLGFGSAKAKRKAEKARAKAEIERAVFEAAIGLATSTQQQFREETAFNVEELQRERQGLRERARLDVAIGESGIGGATTVRQLAASQIQQDIDEGIIEANQETAVEARTAERGAIISGTTLKTKAIRGGVASSGLAALRIAGATAGSVSPSTIAGLIGGK